MTVRAGVLFVVAVALFFVYLTIKDMSKPPPPVPRYEIGVLCIDPNTVSNLTGAWVEANQPRVVVDEENRLIVQAQVCRSI